MRGTPCFSRNVCLTLARPAALRSEGKGAAPLAVLHKAALTGQLSCVCSSARPLGAAAVARRWLFYSRGSAVANGPQWLPAIYCLRCALLPFPLPSQLQRSWRPAAAYQHRLVASFISQTGSRAGCGCLGFSMNGIGLLHALRRRGRTASRRRPAADRRGAEGSAQLNSQYLWLEAS